MVLGRACALALLARGNEAKGLTEQAQQYKTEALVAIDDCQRNKWLSSRETAVLRQSCSASIWQETGPRSGSSAVPDGWGNTTYTHWEDGLWMQGTQREDGSRDSSRRGR